MLVIAEVWGISAVVQIDDANVSMYAAKTTGVKKGGIMQFQQHVMYSRIQHTPLI